MVFNLKNVKNKIAKVEQLPEQKFNCIVNRFLYTDEESGFCIFIGQLTEKEKDGIFAIMQDKTDDLNSIFYKLSEPLKNLVWN